MKLSNNKDWFVLAQLRQLMRKKSHVKSYEVMKSYEVKVFHSRRNWNVDSMQKPERECCWKCWLSPGLAISLTHFQDTGLQEMQVGKIKQRILLWFMLLYIYNQNLLYFMQDLSAVYFIFRFSRTKANDTGVGHFKYFKACCEFFYALLLRQTFLNVITKTCWMYLFGNCIHGKDSII